MKAKIISVLDASGSMSSVSHDLINGYNLFIEDQKSERGEMELSLVVFSTHVDIVYQNVNIQDTTKLTQKEYQVDGLTAMYDGIKTAIELSSEPALIIIQTDGFENSSGTTSSEIKEMISKKISEGFEFVLFGANIDADKVGQSLGITNSVQFNTNKQGMEIVYSKMSAEASRYRAKQDKVKLSPK